MTQSICLHFMVLPIKEDQEQKIRELDFWQ